MKKSLLLSLLILLPLFSNAQEKYFHDLKGMEDSEGITQLFYRIYDGFFSKYETSYIDYYNHVYHLNTFTVKDSLYLSSSNIFSYFTNAHNISGSYLFLDQDIEKPFRVTFSDDTYGNTLNKVRGFNGSYFDAGPNKINSIYQIQADTSTILALNFETKSALITLDSDSLPSIRYNYSYLVKRSDPEDNCDNSTNWPCILGASDSVRIYDYNTLAFESDNDSVLFFQRNDSLLTSADLGETMTFKNTSAPWSEIRSIQKISDSGHLLAQTDTRHIFLENNYNIDSSAVYISDNFGENWTTIFSDTNRVFTTSELNTSTIYIGSGTKVYLWDTAQPLSLLLETEYEITGLYKKPDSEILYVLTRDELLIVENGKATSLKELPISNESEPTTLPNEITLFQNYPNPFNPSTVISFQLPVSSSVKLVVFDMLGRKIATLVDGKSSAGLQEVTFNAQGLSSGMYFFRLEANGFTLTKRLTIIK